MFKSKKNKFKMKLKTIIYTVSFMSLMFFNTTLFAQDSSYDLITKELTKEQRDLLQKERTVMKTNRDAFKATLTKEQLAILRDKTISKSEIRAKLMSTFTNTQKDLVRNQQVRLRKTRDNFRKTLTGEQRKMLKERIDKIRESKDRGELKDGTRQNNVKDGKKRRVRSN
ncbi:hypothetical protein BTO07_07395 [Polaribacter sp. SA4-12]|nr:hypothetical protein BTO07_07395 [Polaribacter sp. SA4-12]